MKNGCTPSPPGPTVPRPYCPSSETFAPSTWLSAIARLTGALDTSGTPLVFSTSVPLATLSTAIQNAITTRNVTPAQYPQITGDVADRAVNLQSPFSNYLLPNFNRVTNLKVR